MQIVNEHSNQRRQIPSTSVPIKTFHFELSTSTKNIYHEAYKNSDAIYLIHLMNYFES